MIYLDYSANTPADSRVLERFCEVERSCPGNANSRHQAGRDAKLVIDHATQTIAGLLSAQPAEVIYTSGASEANNFALKGLAKLSRHLGKHIISTPLEHSSVSGTLTALQEQGYEIDLVDIRRDGTIDLEHLKELLRPDTIAVAVTLVDSELGVVQPVKEISEILQAWPNCHLHVDATQAVGKIPVSFEGVDTMSLTAHKFYGLNGIGLLLKRRRLAHAPLLHGGESTTIGKLLVEWDMLEPLRRRILDGMPVYGSCAGLILLCKEIEGSDQPRLGVLDATVRRNAFGRQVDSFETDLHIDGLAGEPLRAVFIRAPLISRVGEGVRVLARLDADRGERIVAVRQGNVLATSFHPELTPDLRLHQYFLDMLA